MWSIILPGGNTLDFNGEIQYEVNSNIFSTSNTTKLEGTYTYPITLPASPKNRRLLNFPDLVNSATKPATFSNVWVYCLGHAMLSGRLTVRSANRDSIKCDIVATPLRDMKDVKLRDLYMGGPRSMSAYASWDAFMSAVASNPEDFDFGFFPILSGIDGNWLAYTGGVSVNPSSAGYWHNFVNASGNFVSSAGVVTPFLKVEYLLEQLFLEYGSGFTLRNSFQDTTELKRLYLFNNVDVRVLSAGAPVLPSAFDLRRHATEITGPELIKRIAALFNLGLFADYRENQVRLSSLNDIISAAPAVDWTQYQASFPSIEEWGSATPRWYRHPDFKPLPISAAELRTIPRYQNVALWAAAAASSTDEWVYIESAGMLVDVEWYNFPINGVGLYPAYIDVLLRSGESNAYEPVPLLGGSLNYLQSKALPTRYVQETSGAETRWRLQEESADPALMLYRGRQLGSNYPITSNNVWETGGALNDRVQITTAGVAEGFAQEALDWQGDTGLYANRHAQWNEMLYNGKSVSMNLAVPIGEFTRFTLDQKVRLENMDYIVRRLRIQRVDTTGVVFLQADMFSTV